MSTLPMPLQGVLIDRLQSGLIEANMNEYLSGFAGQIIGMVKEIKSAKQIVKEMVEEATNVIEACHTFITE